jgi:hypothetical protein
VAEAFATGVANKTAATTPAVKASTAARDLDADHTMLSML